MLEYVQTVDPKSHPFYANLRQPHLVNIPGVMAATYFPMVGLWAFYVC